MPALIQGRIVWATVPDPQGRNPKDRPLIVLTPDPKDLDDDADLLVVGVTSALHEAPKEHQITLPWSRSPGCLTKLFEPSAAVCSWVVTIKKNAIRKIEGIVPTKCLEQILQKVRELKPGSV